MNFREFVSETICKFSPEISALAKEVLVGEYLFFYFIQDENISTEVLAEKTCDYFKKLEMKTAKSFYKYMDMYLKEVDLLVSRRIAPTPQAKKGAAPAGVPRARKYYEKAAGIIKTKDLKVEDLRDYFRIMFCLYTAIVKNGYKEIRDLDFSIDCIEPKNIVDSLKKDPITNKGMKKMFDNKELYDFDTSFLIVTIIMLFTILNDKMQGEYSYER